MRVDVFFFEVVYRDRTVIVSNPTDFPDIMDTSAHVREVQEPIVKASIIVPEGFIDPSFEIDTNLISSQSFLAR